MQWLGNSFKSLVILLLLILQWPPKKLFVELEQFETKVLSYQLSSFNKWNTVWKSSWAISCHYALEF